MGKEFAREILPEPPGVFLASLARYKTTFPLCRSINVTIVICISSGCLCYTRTVLQDRGDRPEVISRNMLRNECEG